MINELEVMYGEQIFILNDNSNNDTYNNNIDFNNNNNNNHTDNNFDSVGVQINESLTENTPQYPPQNTQYTSQYIVDIHEFHNNRRELQVTNRETIEQEIITLRLECQLLEQKLNEALNVDQ